MTQNDCIWRGKPRGKERVQPKE